jgi:hypothetical protein
MTLLLGLPESSGGRHEFSPAGIIIIVIITITITITITTALHVHISPAGCPLVAAVET